MDLLGQAGDGQGAKGDTHTANRNTQHQDHQAEADDQVTDVEGHDRGVQAGPQHGGVESGGPGRVILRQLGVGLATGGLEGVVVDDVSLGLGRGCAVDLLARPLGRDRFVLDLAVGIEALPMRMS